MRSHPTKREWKSTELALVLFPMLVLMAYVAWNLAYPLLAERGIVPQYVLPHEGAVRAVVYSPNGKWLATVSSQPKGPHRTVGLMQLWEADNPKNVYALPLDISEYATPTLSANSASTISVANRGLLTFNVQTRELTRQFVAEYDGYSALSPDGRFIVTLGNVPRLWDASTYKLLWTLPEGEDNYSIFFSSDSKQLIRQGLDKSYVVSASKKIKKTVYETVYGEQIEVWDIKTRKLQKFIPVKDRIQKFALSPDGRYVATTVFYAFNYDAFDPTGGAIKLIDLQKGRVVWKKKEELTTPKNSFFLPAEFRPYVFDSVTFSPDSKMVVTGSFDGSVRFWDTRSGNELGNFNAGKNQLTTSGYGRGEFMPIAYSPGGKHLATGVGKEVRIWKIKSLVESFQNN